MVEDTGWRMACEGWRKPEYRWGIIWRMKDHNNKKRSKIGSMKGGGGKREGNRWWAMKVG